MHTKLKKAAKCDNTECCDVAEKAGRRVRELVNAADKDIHEVADKAAAEIREKPLQSGALAVGVGLLLGLLLRRR